MNQMVMFPGLTEQQHVMTTMFPAVMQWSHSVIMEEDFSSPWHAVEKAFDLQQEVKTELVDSMSTCSRTLSAGGELKLCSSLVPELLPNSLRTGRHRKCTLRFHDICTVHVGPEHHHGRDCTDWRTFQMNCSHFGMPIKSIPRLTRETDPVFDVSWDSFSLMQRRSFDSHCVPTQPSVLLCRGDPWITANIRPWPLSHKHSDVARYLMIPAERIVACHVVSSAVEGLPMGHTPLIVERQGDLIDSFAQALILVDVILYPPSNVGRFALGLPTVRKVRRCKNWLLRHQVFQLGRVHFYCAFSGHRCWIRLNGQAWNEQDQDFRLIHSGDHLEIHVPPVDHSETGDTCSDVQYIEDIFRTDQESASTEGELQDPADQVSWSAEFSENASGDEGIPGTQVPSEMMVSQRTQDFTCRFVRGQLHMAGFPDAICRDASGFELEVKTGSHNYCNCGLMCSKQTCPSVRILCFRNWHLT